ncbi:MAG: branched-chain amino acid ABC transporter permease, partial [Candidatus Methylomirabilales bacterium]
LMTALHLFVQKTRLGKAMRATSVDHNTARLMGINVDRIIALTFFIGSGLGAASGVMVGLYYRQISFFMGYVYGLKAFTAAVLGGIGNIPGAMVGGLLLGVLEAVGAALFPAEWKDVIAFAILIGVLIFKPRGLLGERVAQSV